MMIGATKVVDGKGKVIATSTNANLEDKTLALDFTSKIPEAVVAGANYILKAGNGKSYKCTCQYIEAPRLVMFRVN